VDLTQGCRELSPGVDADQQSKLGTRCLLDELPYLGYILPAKDGDGVAQVTVTAVLTDETLAAPPEIDPRQDGYNDTGTHPPP
jgi:hypothetical protein